MIKYIGVACGLIVGIAGVVFWISIVEFWFKK
jgi:hypothetical protein